MDSAKYESVATKAAKRIVQNPHVVDALGYGQDDYKSSLLTHALSVKKQHPDKGDLYVYKCIWNKMHSLAHKRNLEMRRRAEGYPVEAVVSGESLEHRQEAAQLVRRLRRRMKGMDIDILMGAAHCDGHVTDSYYLSGVQISLDAYKKRYTRAKKRALQILSVPR